MKCIHNRVQTSSYKCTPKVANQEKWEINEMVAGNLWRQHPTEYGHWIEIRTLLWLKLYKNMYNVLKVPTFRLNLQPSSGESEKIIRKKHVS